ncbi:YcjX family protein [Amphritea pacifica]|uniref:YcjX family protein n=1 Tax=Amphritea pacifica TaxID=2811233 RepID=UPI001962BB14|nr:YcjX family protein [Amphritea pacifica]MBN1009009.1 YcjX family protein [Amphritea pacifica]
MSNNGQSDYLKKLHHVTDDAKTLINRAIQNRVCIGITGLSRSGKSTFITSLINQLKQHGAKNSRLGGFSPWLKKRIIQVTEHPLENRYLPRFDYEQAVDSLSGSAPQWPMPTRDISGVLLEIKLADQGWFGRKTSKSVFIELRDYPGEWLVDLPLLKMSFRDWCVQVEKQLSRAPRSSFSDNPQASLKQLDPFADYNAATVETQRAIYIDFLHACKKQSPPLTIIQPGRFIEPGTQTGHPALHFVPLIACAGYSEAQLQSAGKNSNFKQLEAIFERYKSDIVKPFFKEFIEPIDRQVVLVDVLNVLHGGEAYLHEMMHALEAIGESFEYNGGLFRSRIEKVLYAATKVDQVVSQDHDNVRHLLSSIVRKSLERIQGAQADLRVEAVASVRSSHAQTQGNEEILKGISSEGEAIGFVNPRIPDHIPSESEFTAFIDWKLPQLNPPKSIRANQDQAIPHIRMDEVLHNLMGDICR